MILENNHAISIGLVVPGTGAEETVAGAEPLGFESYEPVWRDTVSQGELDALRPVLEGKAVSALGVYGNTLTDPETLAGLGRAIASAGTFGTDLVCCFAGRLTGEPVPASIPRFREVFSDLAKKAADSGVRIALENCLQGGCWASGDRNIAHGPAAWELLFDAVPAENLGLEWEPAHQLCQLAEPLPQLRKWAPKIFHLHGKDAFVRHEVVREMGVSGAVQFAEFRFPGFGDTDWAHIIAELRLAGFTGAIDIEGRHDKSFPPEHEMEGCVAALGYLKRCRG